MSAPLPLPLSLSLSLLNCKKVRTATQHSVLLVPPFLLFFTCLLSLNSATQHYKYAIQSLYLYLPFFLSPSLFVVSPIATWTKLKNEQYTERQQQN